MPIFAQSSLSYVGSRTYIRGADLFGLFDRQLRALIGDSRMPSAYKSFRLLREVLRDGRWHLPEAGESLPAEASASLDVMLAAGDERRALFIEDGAVITGRTPQIGSFVSDLEDDGDFAGRAKLTGIAGPEDLMNALIEANKRLHSNTLARQGRSPDNIRLIYVEHFPRLDMAESLILTHRGSRSARGRTYTLNQARFNRDGQSWEAAICYSC